MKKLYNCFRSAVQYLTIIFITVMLCGLAVRQTAFAEMIEYSKWNGFTYATPYEGEVSIYKYTGTEAVLKIPNEIKGGKVTSIEGSAFRKCKSLKSVYIPEGVVAGSTLLSSAPSLVKVTVSKNHELYAVVNNLLLNKKKRILINCPGGKKQVKIPKSVKFIRSYAFSKSSIQKIRFGKNVTWMDSSAFKDCKKLKTVSMNNKIRKLNHYTFAGCTNLEQVKLSENIVSIEESAFSGCKSLKNISIPKKVKKIGHSAFFDCKSLETISLPKSVKTIELNAFYKCKSLRSIYIYNKNCKIEQDEYYEDYDIIPKKTVIYGYKGSTAEAFAKAEGYKFQVIQL